MHIEFRGRIKAEDFARVVSLTMNMLAAEDIATITSVSLNFLAWGPNGARRQVVDDDDYVTSLAIPAEEIAARPAVVRINRPETLHFRDRPDDLEFSFFNLGARRDD